MLDRDLLLRKLADLDLYLSQASEFRAVTADEYRRDWETQRVVERTLQLAIEACLDVASHIVADRQLRVPSTYAAVFEVLGEAGLLDDGLRETMVRIARFRNILVHDYARIEPAAVVRSLREGLDDLRRFGEAALGWL